MLSLSSKSHFTKVFLFDYTIDSDNDPDNLSKTANFNNTADSRETYFTFISKCQWQPPRQVHDLETFVSRVESDIVSHKSPKPRHDNLTKKRHALHFFQRRNDIVIKPAGKESAVVILDRGHYVSEADRQLNDWICHELLEHDPTDQFA